MCPSNENETHPAGHVIATLQQEALLFFHVTGVSERCLPTVKFEVALKLHGHVAKELGSLEEKHESLE